MAMRREADEADEDAETIACGNYLLNTLDQSKLAAYTAISISSIYSLSSIAHRYSL